MFSLFSAGRHGCSTFFGCGLAPELCRRLADKLSISKPTLVQSKSLKHVLEGRHVVVNAETGSGKTLCYLLPSLAALLSTARGQSSPHSLVLVPTPDLAEQVGEVFLSLAGCEVPACSVVHGGSRLSLLPHTHLVIATPTSLMNYDLQRIMRGVQLMCVDEADALLTGGQKTATTQLLREFFGGRGEVPRQLIVTAATLPHGGRQTAGSLLSRWLPRNTLYITTHLTHHTVSSSHHTFTDITHQTTPTSRDHLMVVPKLNQLKKDLEHHHGNESRILVFVNTQSTAELVYRHLNGVSGEATPPWWAGHVRQLHGGMSVGERGEVVRGVREGEVRVLVATDLLSRGMDLPNITAVVQYDFPENSAMYLHRAGRTARAGREGKVISYTEEKDRELAQEIRRVLDDESRSFQEIFSRNKMLRRKIKARKLRQLNRELLAHDSTAQTTV